MESATVASDKGSTTLGKNGNTKLENNYLCRCQDYSMTDGLFQNTRIAKGGTPLPPHLPRARKGEREKKECKRCKLFKIINFTPSIQKIRQAIF
jgi:hypothetical protein